MRIIIWFLTFTRVLGNAKQKYGRKWHGSRSDDSNSQTYTDVSLIQCMVRAGKEMTASYQDGVCQLSPGGTTLVSKPHWTAVEPVKGSPYPWKLLQRNVCFGVKDDNPGVITFTRSGLLTAMRLVHVSGSMTCLELTPFTNFGCDAKQYTIDQIGIVITTVDRSKPAVFPPGWNSANYYMLPGFHAYSPAIEFYDTTTPRYVETGTQLNIFEIQDWKNDYDSNNEGNGCVDVFVQF